MGREIGRLLTLPANEPFTFPSASIPFFRVSSLFAVLLSSLSSPPPPSPSPPQPRR